MAAAIEIAAESAATCLIDGNPMQHWMHIPVDALRGIPNSCPDLYRCRCGYASVWPLPSPKQVASFYEIEYYKTIGEAMREDSPSFLDRLRLHLAWRVDRDRVRPEEWFRSILGTSVSSVCDLGCGAGQHIKFMAQNGYKVSGVEADEKTAAKLAAEGLDVHNGTVEVLPAATRGRKFDAVIMSHVLEHCLDPKLALKNARSILNSDGILICEVPNQDCIARRLAGPTWWHFDVPRHLRFFTGSQVAMLAERSGFQVKRIEYARYCAQFSNHTISEERRTRRALGFGPWNSKGRAWLQLALTAFAPARYKYDSVRIVAIAD